MVTLSISKVFPLKSEAEFFISREEAKRVPASVNLDNCALSAISGFILTLSPGSNGES